MSTPATDKHRLKGVGVGDEPHVTIRLQIGQLAFEWDHAKAVSNAHKHRITFLEAATVFGDAHARYFADPDHSQGEARYLARGYSDAGHLLVVSYTERGPGLRLISARLASRRERQQHEQST